MKITQHLVLLNQNPSHKDSAIHMLTDILIAEGKVEEGYAESILQRENVANTYLGNGIAIPHGIPEQRHLIKETAIAVMQVPQGIDWGEDGEQAKLIICIAAQGSEHLDILRRLTRLLKDKSTLETLFSTHDTAVICNTLNGEETQTSTALGISPAPQFTYQKILALPNPQGMHARPATSLVKLATSLKTPVIIQTTTGQRADASKMFEILGLGLKQHAEITLFCDDENALKRVVEEITLGLGDDLSQKIPTRKFCRQGVWTPEGNIRSIQGVSASDGLVIGRVKQHMQQGFTLPEAVGTLLEECDVLDAGLLSAKQNLETLMKSAPEKSDELTILEAHMAILNDTDMISETVGMIRKGSNAIRAYHYVSESRINALSAVEDEHIAARANDILDVRNHVMRAMLDLGEDHILFDEPVVLFAEDLTPSDTMKLSPKNVLAFVTSLGGPTGHSAIIARNMGIPAVVAAGDEIADIADGDHVIVDGVSGTVYLSPTAEQIASAQTAQKALHEKNTKEQQYRQEAGQTKDGTTIEISANINEAGDVASAVELGAQGVGLMRTEFLYLSQTHIPSEQEQYEKYRAIAKALGNKPLIIRTLDIGGDKEVDYLGLEKEENAFLGVRGIRLCFERPDLFIPQLRAICRAAAEYSNIHVMFPMIGKLADWEQAKSQLDSVREELDTPAFPVGVMIEVPSAALMAMELAEHVDFFSVGTNDLTQYTLAMDRMHPVLASQADAMHPAVLRLIEMTVNAAKAHGKWVGVCGGAAGDVSAAKVLVGLGITELSMSPSQIASVKYMLRKSTHSELVALARDALKKTSATNVRELLAQHASPQGES